MSRQKPRRRQKEAEARKKQWEKTRKEYDWSNFDAYGDRITGKRPREAVNGRRLSDDLRRLFTLTGDPAFETARLALKAYHLDVGRHKATARRLAEEEFLLYNFWDPIEHMEGAMNDGTGRSLRDSAEECVAIFGLPGASFERAVDHLRTKYARFRLKHGSLSKYREPSGDTGRRICIAPVDEDGGNERGPTGGVEDADSLANRRALAAGRIWIRFLGKNEVGIGTQKQAR